MRQVLLIALLISVFTYASGQTNVRQKNYNVTKGLAIEGYDPVSYFKNKPEKGSPSYAFVYDGITYHFTSPSNLATFKQNPAGYEPQYGGWCAYAMGSKGEKVEVDPETFKIINGKLYLFYNHLLNNTLKTWNKNEEALKPQADANWKKINH